jgi:hypothetical protein
MDYNFQIVLFKNKIKKKIINKFKTLKKTVAQFNKLLEESNDVIFPVKYENGSSSTYELSILEKRKANNEKLFIKDEFGRQIKVNLDDDDFTINKIVSYNIEEEFLDYLKERMHLSIVKHSPLTGKRIQKVALCGGAGIFLLGDAKKAGADVFVTADIKYHEYFDAEGALVLCDIGHYESEIFTKDLLADVLSQNFPNIALYLSKVVTNPTSYR